MVNFYKYFKKKNEDIRKQIKYYQQVHTSIEVNNIDDLYNLNNYFNTIYTYKDNSYFSSDNTSNSISNYNLIQLYLDNLLLNIIDNIFEK